MHSLIMSLRSRRGLQCRCFRRHGTPGRSQPRRAKLQVISPCCTDTMFRERLDREGGALPAPQGSDRGCASHLARRLEHRVPGCGVEILSICLQAHGASSDLLPSFEKVFGGQVFWVHGLVDSYRKLQRRVYWRLSRVQCSMVRAFCTAHSRRRHLVVLSTCIR
jgi:hypothetical protein